MLLSFIFHVTPWQAAEDVTDLSAGGLFVV
jgi:hypothetical protein